MTGKWWILLTLALWAAACKKNNNGQGSPPPPAALSYGDTLFFLDPGGAEVKANPLHPQPGRYYGFPKGIDIDGNTGVINVSKSETGLRYQVYFVPDGSQDTAMTTIAISGINFLDGFYKLSTADSVVHPLYNGRKNQLIPGIGNGSIFDEGANCNSQGCVVNTQNGQINLAQTVRNGVFGATPTNNDRHEFRLDYRIDDKSGKAANTLNVKLYYFDTMADVTPEVYDILNSREGTIVTGLNTKAAKPRPPCIFIIAR